MDESHKQKRGKRNVIQGDFGRCFTDAEVDEMEIRLAMAESVTFPKADAMRIIRRMRAAKPGGN